MPKPKSSDPRKAQVLLRLTDTEARVLEAVAHLEGVTASTYAYGLVSRHLSSLANDPHVRADLANREAYDVAGVASSSIDARKTKKRGLGPSDVAG